MRRCECSCESGFATREHGAARVVGREAEPVGRVGGHVGERLRLREAGAEARVGDRAAHALGGA